MTESDRNIATSGTSAAQDWSQKSVACTYTDESKEESNAALHWRERTDAGGRSVLDRSSVLVCHGTAADVEESKDEAQRAKELGDTFAEGLIGLKLCELGYTGTACACAEHNSWSAVKDEVRKKIQDLSDKVTSGLAVELEPDANDAEPEELLAYINDSNAIPAFLQGPIGDKVDADSLAASTMDLIKYEQRLFNALTTSILKAIEADGCVAAEALEEHREEVMLDGRVMDTALVEAIRGMEDGGDRRAAYEALVMNIKDSDGVQFVPWEDHAKLLSSYAEVELSGKAMVGRLTGSTVGH